MRFLNQVVIRFHSQDSLNNYRATLDCMFVNTCIAILFHFTATYIESKLYFYFIVKATDVMYRMQYIAIASH